MRPARIVVRGPRPTVIPTHPPMLCATTIGGAGRHECSATAIDLACPLVHAVGVAPAAVAVARQVERDDAVLVGEQGRDVVPPARVRGTAVDEDEAGRSGAPQRR